MGNCVVIIAHHIGEARFTALLCEPLRYDKEVSHTNCVLFLSWGWHGTFSSVTKWVWYGWHFPYIERLSKYSAQSWPWGMFVFNLNCNENATLSLAGVDKYTQFSCEAYNKKGVTTSREANINIKGKAGSLRGLFHIPKGSPAAWDGCMPPCLRVNKAFYGIFQYPPALCLMLLSWRGSLISWCWVGHLDLMVSLP